MQPNWTNKRVFLSIILSAFLASSAAASDWTMFAHDPGHTGYASDETLINAGNIAQLQPLWKFNVGGGIGSAVTVSKGKLYFGDWTGTFWAINAADGTVLWKQFVGKAPDPADTSCGPGIGVDSQPVVSNGLVYVGGGDSAVYALDQNTGAIQWRTPLADPASGSYLWSSITLANNSLYIGIASFGDCPLVRGGLARIPLDSPDTPVLQYFAPADGEGASVWSTPAVDTAAGLIYVTTGNGDAQNASTGNYGSAMIALDATTLEIKSWYFLPLLATDVDADWGSSPTLFNVGATPYSAATSKTGLLAVVKRPNLGPTGNSLWTQKLFTDCVSPEEGCGSIASPVFDGKTLYVAGGQSDEYASTNGNVFGIDPAARSVLWQHSFPKAVLAPLTVVPGVLFASTLQGLYALSTLDGTELWNDGTSAIVYSQPVVSNGVLYVTYLNGDVIAYGPPTPAAGALPAISTNTRQANFTYTMGGSTPAKQAFTVLSQGSAIPFSIQTDSTWANPSSTQGTTTANLTILPQFSALGPGAHSAKLTVVSPASSNGSTDFNVNVIVNPAPPTPVPADVVSSASGTALLSPGSLFTIYLNGVAGTTISAKSAPLPLSLGGLSVLINGVAAPVLFVSPNQINAQIPYSTKVGNATVVISSGGMKTAAVSVPVQAAAPSLFMSDGTHSLAQNSDYSLNSTSNPATPGDFVIVYFTGQGPVTLPVYNGTPVDYQNIHQAKMTTVATVGGQPARVFFSGLTPGFIGLGQANIEVPALPPGDYPMTLQIGSVVSNTATISVGASQQ